MRFPVIGAAALPLLLLFAPAAPAQDRAQPEPRAGEDGPVLFHLERVLQAASARIADSVVRLEVEREEAAEAPPPPEAPPGEEAAYVKRPDGPVSGLAIGTRRILTSAYNVERAKRIEVLLAGGRQVRAKLVGLDEGLDLALLELEAPASDAGAVLMPARFSDAADPRVGAFLVAVGRSATGELLVNSGIVSALGRFSGDALQTDAALNYGNYGGAAVDAEGKLVGLVARPPLSGKAGINSGVGFVIPAARIRDVLPDLEKGVMRKVPPRAFLGIQFGKELLEPPGVEVLDVLKDTAAAAAGLQKGDVLRRIGDLEAFDQFTIRDAILARRPGDVIRLEIDRDGKRIGFEVRLGGKAADR